MTGKCEFCGETVRRGEAVAYRVRGWEIQRKQGGANHIVGKERQPGRVAHAVCVEARVSSERMGLRGQMSL